jgi:hypothetical protein
MRDIIMPNTDAPSELANEAALNHRLLLDHSGRVFAAIPGSRWGELILPAPDELPVHPSAGLRIVLFASFEFGYTVFEAIKAYANLFPGRVQIVGLVTDDPVSSTARIGLKKRVWRYLDRDEILAAETAIVEAALREGVPAYTGEIKIPAFRELLASWQPDVIISCVFGQVIDSWIINQPAYGIYNFHPSDLAHGFGAGPAPAEDLAARGASSTVWTVHQVTEAVDAGHIVTTSPPINVLNRNGLLPADPLLIYDKIVEPVGYLAACLIDALADRFSAGLKGRIDAVDVAAAVPADMRVRMLEPISIDQHVTTLPKFDATSLAAFD